MTNKMRSWVSIAVLCLLPISLAVASAEVAEFTLGDFAVHLAKLITQKSDVAPEDAVAFLDQLGVELQGELDGEIGEQQLVDAFHQLGLNLTTSTPEANVTPEKAGHVFQMFDSNDRLFSGEVFRLCKHGTDSQNTPCITDDDCGGLPDSCQDLPSVRCQKGSNEGEPCMTDADCPMGACNIPPGQFRKIFPASPDD